MEIAVHQTASTRQNNLLLFKGFLAIAWGIMALIAASGHVMVLTYAFGALNIIAGVLTFLYAYRNKHLKISHQWLLMEGIVEIIAGIVFLFFVPDINTFILYMSYGIMFIVIVQFIYGYFLLMTNVLHAKNLIARFVSLIAGSVVSIALLTNTLGTTWSLVIIGLFSILYGILNAQFAVKLRNIIMGEAE